ncbi:MAG: hypothetical protein KAW12_01045 [Candidatus Aminicenantes bacterium]|nr:hypothetical protein [Candidatus Aminicenantes bacterium]
MGQAADKLQTTRGLKALWKQKLKNMASPDGYVTIDQMASALGVSRSNISDAITFGKLEAIKMKVGSDDDKVSKVRKEWVLNTYLPEILTMWRKTIDGVTKTWIDERELLKKLKLPPFRYKDGEVRISERASNCPVIIPLKAACDYVDALQVVNEPVLELKGKDGCRQLPLFS